MLKKKVYIKKIELINFESHKHSILDNFSQGFNCITGESDAGKTSIFRALMLCAYNEFNQESVRLGSDFCEVTITTNLGSVNVKRGKNVNLWTVSKEGNSVPVVFDKVGKSPVEEACAILGMRMIKLGDTEVPVNLMDQLERHFLISSIGDEKTSGSGRAEIIDEICGLNGTEDLVKTISLDQYRLTREITTLEERANELSSKLHDDQELEQELRNIKRLEELELNINISNENKEFVKNLLEAYQFNYSKLISIKDKIKSFPETDKCEDFIKQVRELSLKLKQMLTLKNDYENAKQKLNINKTVLSKLSDVSDLNVGICKDLVLKLKSVKELYDNFSSLRLKEKNVKEKIESLKRIEIDDQMSEIKILLSKVSDYKKLYKEHSDLKIQYDKVKQSIQNKTNEEIKLQTEINELYKNIDICPVTKKVITEQCSLWDFKE